MPTKWAMVVQIQIIAETAFWCQSEARRSKFSRFCNTNHRGKVRCDRSALQFPPTRTVSPVVAEVVGHSSSSPKKSATMCVVAAEPYYYDTQRGGLELEPTWNCLSTVERSNFMLYFLPCNRFLTSSIRAWLWVGSYTIVPWSRTHVFLFPTPAFCRASELTHRPTGGSSASPSG